MASETAFGDVQRYLCKQCGHRFSDPESQRLSHENVKQPINTQGDLVSNYRLRAILQEAKKWITQ